MGPVTSLLTAIERQDVVALTDVIEHHAMHEENLTYEEAVALWDVGWQEWNAADRTGHSSWQAIGEGQTWHPLWRITLGEFLHVLHTTFPALPGVLAWTDLGDVEEE
ncbi:MAG TPA: hypothetical protein VI542_17225 [Candidatus Tectomicrobia bacterium]